jgi:integrase
VNELILRFWSFVREHYRDPYANQSSEVENYRYSLKPIRELYGSTLACEFGPLALKAVRQRMVDAGLSRGLINQRVGRIKRMFKWAASEELVPPLAYQVLQTVTGLQRGRSKAREREPVGPVRDEQVEAVLPHVNRYVRAMVQVQRLTGMRPGEVCLLRRADIEQSRPIWLYTPKCHKTAWRGKSRVVGLGPQAQAMIRAFFTDNPADYLFSPRRMMTELRTAQRAAREATGKAPRACQKKARPRRRPGERYSTRSYAQAIAKGCRKAEVARWHPNQLRHAYATEVRRLYGLEAAQVGLGHSRADVTQVYAERDLRLVEKIAAERG